MEKLYVRGMKKSLEQAKALEKTLRQATGVNDLTVNPETGEVCSASNVCLDQQILKEAIENAGFRLGTD